MRIWFIFLFFVTTVVESCQLAYDHAADALKKEKWDEAYEMLVPLVTDNPDKADLLYDTGVAVYNKDRYAQALTYFDRAATKTNDNALKINAYFNAGNACVPLKELRKAIEYYDLVLSIDASNEYAQHNKKCVEEMIKQQEQQQEQKQQDQQKDQHKDQQDKQQQNDEQSSNDDNSQGGDGNKDDQDDQKNEQQGDDESQKESDQKEGSDRSDSGKSDAGQKEGNKKQEGTNADDDKQRDSKNQSDDQSHQEQEQRNSEQGNQHKNSPQNKQDQQKLNDSNVASESTQDQAEKETEHAQVAAQQGQEEIAQALKEALNDPWLSGILQKQEERDKATNRQLMEAKMRQNGGKNAYNNW